MKKTAANLLLASELLIIALAGVSSVNLVSANPFASPLYSHSIIEKVIPLPEGTKLPVVTIFSPQNSTSYASKDILLNFSVTSEKSNNISLSVYELYYVASWQNGRTGQIGRKTIDMKSVYVTYNSDYSFYYVSVNLTNVPEGPRWLQVYARSGAIAYKTGYQTRDLHHTTYYAAYEETLSSSKVEFTIDTTPPRILSLSLENKTYDTSNVPFTLTTNEPISQVSYSLDGQANTTVAGETALTNLYDGKHSLTVYATDPAGNIGVSKTVYFNVEAPNPFPPLPIIVVSVVAVFIFNAALLVYLKKRNHKP
jgi:hypothetical protein